MGTRIIQLSIEVLCSATHVPGPERGHKWSQVFKKVFGFSTFATGSETEERIQIRALPH